LRQRSLDLGPETPLRFLRYRIHQGVAAWKMPERGPRRHPGAARSLAHAYRRGATLLNQLQRGLDQDAPEIAVMIGFWRRWRAAAGSAFRFGGDGHGKRLASTKRECKHCIHD
jgi:hypothetical protein